MNQHHSQAELTCLLALVAVFVVGCSTTRIVTKTRLPARSHAMQAKQRVAVEPFRGRHGDKVTRLLRAAVARGRHHTLVEAGGNPDVVISGKVADLAYTTSVDQLEQKRCVAKDKKGRCTKKTTIPIYTRAESCTAKVQGKLTRVADRSVILDRVFARDASDSQAQEKNKPGSQETMLCATALEKAVGDLTAFATPYEATVALDFHDIDDDGTTKEAVEMARASRFSRARELLQSVVKTQPLSDEQQAWAHYNLATVLWAMGQFKQCLNELDTAQEVLSSDDSVSSLYRSCQEYVQ